MTDTPNEPESLHEAIMAVVMHHNSDPTGMTINLSEASDALLCSLCWVLSLTPTLQTKRDIRKLSEALGKSIATGIEDAREFNRKNGMTDMLQMMRAQ
jgi:hypothetical protein